MKWWLKLFPSPPSCWICAGPVHFSAYSTVWNRLCVACQEQITPMQMPVCMGCGRGWEQCHSTLCFDCVRIDERERVSNRSAASYSPFTKKLVQIYKYRGKESLARPMGAWMAEVVREHFADQTFSLITFVPMHEERLRERGFNQAELLAIEVGKQLQIPVVPMLKRVRSTAAQSKRSRSERLLALRNIFQIAKKENRDWIENIKILVVDDVYTTGATLRECAKSLRQAGVAHVCSVTFAR
jgi:competence protein ComFC